MKLLFPEPYGNTATEAFAEAMKRGVLPSWLGTEELAQLEAAIRERAVFSARTTNAVYLEALKSRIGRLLADGYDGDMAKLRLELKQLLMILGYDPETGFPGDAALGVPSAEPGSLRDLSSDRRINLILDTQLELMAGRGQQQRGMEEEALDLFPAWELIRSRRARVPRDWFGRWKQAGGRVLEDAEGRKRLIAHKRDEVWSVLGDRALFRDALGVDHPPFAFGSGMVWRAVEADEWEALLELNGLQPRFRQMGQPSASLPAAQISTDGLSRDAVERLAATMKNVEEKNGRLTLAGSLTKPPAPPPSARLRRLNALGETLLTSAEIRSALTLPL